jgi:hypothetical protein
MDVKGFIISGTVDDNRYNEPDPRLRQKPNARSEKTPGVNVIKLFCP